MKGEIDYGEERNTNLDPRVRNPLQILNGVDQALEATDCYSDAVQEFESYKQRVFDRENNCTIEDERLFKALMDEYSDMEIEPGEEEAVEVYAEPVSEISSKYDEWGKELADELWESYQQQRTEITSDVAADSNPEGVEIL